MKERITVLVIAIVLILYGFLIDTDSHNYIALGVGGFLFGYGLAIKK